MKILQTDQPHLKIVRYVVFISSHDQSIGPINLTGLFSTRSLPNWFHSVVCAPNPRDKIWEGNQ